MAFIIQSSPPWLRSESTLCPPQTVSEQLLHQIIFWCYAKDRGNNVTRTQWYFCAVHRQKQRWWLCWVGPKPPHKHSSTKCAQSLVAFQARPSGVQGCLLWQTQRFGKHWQTCSPVINLERPTPFFQVSEYQSLSQRVCLSTEVCGNFRSNGLHVELWLQNQGNCS